MSRSLLDLTGHEKILLVLYRVVPPETRAALDRTLYDAWQHAPRPSDPRAHNAKFETAMRQLKAQHIGAAVLGGFKSFWAEKGGE